MTKTGAFLSHDVEQFLLQYWRDLGTPLSLKLSRLLLAGDFERLAWMIDNFNFLGIKEPARLLKARCAVDIIKKADYLPLKIDRVESAVSKWAASEAQCRCTNLEVKRALRNQSNCNATLQFWLPKVAKTLKRMLGSIPDLNNIFGGFGPGATLSTTRAASSVLHKLQTDTPTITPKAVWFLPALPERLRNLWTSYQNPVYASAGRFQLVPKTYKTDRPIMVEPLINAFIQRYLGKALRERLRILGVDLSIAPNRHRELAKIGSIDGSWATIDLSAASDTISYQLVKALLPEDWFRLLDHARTPQIDLGDIWFSTDVYPKCSYIDILKEHGILDFIHTLEKFSSMGNGFTFELETLIFLAICSTVVGRANVAGVFGDDIIVRDSVVDEVLPVLKAFGFVVNMDKSFWRLPYFRESCGGDYLHGHPVKGVTLKTIPSCPTDWYELHNRLWMLQEENPFLSFERTLLYIRKQVPKRFRFAIPARLGTGGFFHHSPSCKTKHGIHYFKCLVPRRKYLRDWENSFDPEVILAALLIRGVDTVDAGITDRNVSVDRDNGWPLGPVWCHQHPGFREAWVPCS